MAFNGSGLFVRLFNWVTDKAGAIDITASRVDAEDDGFAAGLSLCLTRDGQGKMATDFIPGVDAAYDLGIGGARWRDLTLSRNAAVNGTLTVNGSTTFNGATISALSLTGQLTGASLKTTSSPSVQGLGPVAAAFVDMTPDLVNTANVTATGFAAAVPSTTVRLRRTGNVALCQIDGFFGTSNAAGFTLPLAVPAAFQPTRNQLSPAIIQDNGVTQIGIVQITAGSGTISFFLGSGLAFTASGQKGAPQNLCFSYQLA